MEFLERASTTSTLRTLEIDMARTTHAAWTCSKRDVCLPFMDLASSSKLQKVLIIERHVQQHIYAALVWR